MKYTIIKTSKNRVKVGKENHYEHMFIINTGNEIRFYTLTFPQSRYFEGKKEFNKNTTIKEFIRLNVKQVDEELDSIDKIIFTNIKSMIAKEIT
jgi:hypothetical protein